MTFLHLGVAFASAQVVDFSFGDWDHASMALTIENPETERLAAEVAAMTGESKTEAVRKALEERRLRLAPPSASVDRVAKLRRFLEEEVWPQIPSEARGKKLTKEEEEEILGYGPDGV